MRVTVIHSSGTKCLNCHSETVENGFLTSSNIHESVATIINNITSNDDREEDDSDVFLGSDKD